MTTDKLNDGVGKKIVDALKMQSELEEDNGVNESTDDFAQDYAQSSADSDLMSNDYSSSDISAADNLDAQAALADSAYINSAFQQSLEKNLGSVPVFNIQDEFEYPANVAVLKQLIAKLPTGVSRQTGALIIKQTMEALGISMQNVMQEAKQVKDTLLKTSKDYQGAIVEYRKQIGILEVKSQQYQRQAAIMNDIINLFV